jgi:hypothetical protein
MTSYYHNGIPIKTGVALIQQADWDQDLDTTVRHAAYKQDATGWTLTSGNEVMAQCDHKGRVKSRRYCAQMGFAHNNGATTTIWIEVIEQGTLVTITFPYFECAVGAVSATLNSTGSLPLSICPLVVSNQNIQGRQGVAGGAYNGLNCSVAVFNNGAVGFYGGPTGSLFIPVPGQVIAIRPFSITYDSAYP